ncbi:MAG: hypothetical protein V3U35_02850 [Candidatus Neomarinimicrobiota bacterium]
MIYSDLILRGDQWQRLTAAYVNDRLAHAYLFYGPPGSGKEAHAIELAALLNCQTLRPFDYAQGRQAQGDALSKDQGETLRQAQGDTLTQAVDGACGVCPACRKVQVLQHPNIQIVVPLPRRNQVEAGDPPLKALKPADITNLTDQLAAKATDPYFHIGLEGANTILINSVRELRRTAYLKPGEAGWRAVLIFQAERLGYPHSEAANALLKLLEEPPAETVFVLVTHRPHLLLDTIRSRCLGLYFPPLTTAQAADYLARRFDLTDEDARALAQVSGGDLTKARSLAQLDGSPLAAIDELATSLLAPKPTGWQQTVNDLAQLRRREAQAFHTRMQLLALWLRDLMVLGQGGAGSGNGLLFGSRKAELQRQLEGHPTADWGAAAAAVEQAQNLLERNVQPTLVLTNMILDVREAISRQSSAVSGQPEPHPSTP